MPESIILNIKILNIIDYIIFPADYKLITYANQIMQNQHEYELHHTLLQISNR